MARTVSVTIPHSLGAQEAKRRLADGLETLKTQYADRLSEAQVAWRDNHADLRVGALGQTIDARLDVEAQALRIEVDLPWILAMLAAPLQAALTKTGQETLRIGRD